MGILQPGDGNAMGCYLQHYVYDEVGNILQMLHSDTDPSQSGWTRTYNYHELSLLEPGKFSNRLTSTQCGNDPAQLYSYDTHGNMTTMSHLPLMQWDYRDMLQATTQQVVNNGGTPETTYYVYDASGQRVRKVTERQVVVGQVPTLLKERIYLGGFEIYREYGGDGHTITLERETLAIIDDKQRVALIETRTQGSDNSLQQLVRYQFSNHLGSASLELDEHAQIISYEEYYPYGSTSYQAVRSLTETPKRYRYTGKERDEENGLYYHGVRYYACWLGRWASCDPAELVDGMNLYTYARNNPIALTDPHGTDSSTSIPDYDPEQDGKILGIVNGSGGITPIPGVTKEEIAQAPKTPVKRSEALPSVPKAAPATEQSWLHTESTVVPFYTPPMEGDVITPVATYDTGNTGLNILTNTWLGLSNLTAAIINTPGNMMVTAEKGAKAVGFSDIELQAVKDFTPEFGLLSEAKVVTALPKEVEALSPSIVELNDIFAAHIEQQNVRLGSDLSHFKKKDCYQKMN